MKKFILILICFITTTLTYGDPCAGIVPINCGDTIQFTVTGVGDPNYPNGMNGQGCSSGTAQGGLETIYRFVVPVTGTYQINTTFSNSNYVDYYYRLDNDSCNYSTGWNCIGRTNAGNVGLGAYNWNAGDTVLLLLNAENSGTSNQSFVIKCATVVCNNVVTINCGDTTQFTPFGYGDPNYSDGMNGQGCSSGTAQGGLETIYRFVVPVTGTYQINTTFSNSNYVDYYYRLDNDSCNYSTGWNCIGRTNAGNVGLEAYNWNAGDTVLLLLNAEATGTTNQSFVIKCAFIPCNNVVPINCGDTTLFAPFGYGDPNYPNGMNGQGCSAGTSQGGTETIYRFVVPASGTYQINTTFSSSAYVDYYYRLDNDSCNYLSGWNCIGRTNGGNVGLGAYNWNAGDTVLLLLNAEGIGTTNQSFVIKCAFIPCNNVVRINYGDTTQFVPFGYGDPNYPNGMNGQGCSAGTSQGGTETIYRFVVPASGTYQINTTFSSSAYVDYYYRLDNDSCNYTAGWNCIGRTNAGNVGLGAYNWNAGDTVLLLLNAEGTGTTNQSFTFNNPLITPLRLISFKAINYGSVNKLFWTTGYETNTDQFIVENSQDGIAFNTIGEVRAAFNSSQNLDYEYEHHITTPATNYYRLKMLDVDGAFSYSKIVSVNNMVGSAISIMPNPVKNMLHVRVYYNKPGNGVMKLTDMQGRVLQSKNISFISGTTDAYFDVSSLAAGSYVLTMDGKAGIKKIFIKE